MKTTIFTVGALLAALAVPVGASAQQGPPPNTTAPQGQHVTQSESVIQAHWMSRLGGLNLSSQQQQQIQSLIDQYAQAHPAGSPRDRHASRALRKQIMSVLTPDQQTQLRQQMQAKREQRQQQRGRAQQPDQQQPDDQQPAGPPPNGPPPNGAPPA